MAPDRISPPSALLLLPPPPSSSFDQFKNVYEPILCAVYPKLLQSLGGTNRTAYLDIALTLPGLRSPTCQPPAKAFTSLQDALEKIYRLIGVVCVENKIEMEGSGGIDTRVILLDFDLARSSATGSRDSRSGLQNGPIVDLQTLASSGRLWDFIFYPDTSVGQALAAAFSSIYTSTKDPNGGDPQPIPGIPQWTPAESGFLVPGDRNESVTHASVAVGGTFDHFHIGHKLLLTATALALQPGDPSQERLLTIGVTGDEMLKNKKYAQFLESWDDRCESTRAFLASIMDFAPPDSHTPRIERVSQPGPNGRCILMKVRPGITLNFVQILDPFGPTVTEESISALVVSKETRSGGPAINQERAKRGWRPLVVFEVDVLHSGETPAGDVEDFASKISSTDIRRRRMELAMI